MASGHMLILAHPRAGFGAKTVLFTTRPPSAAAARFAAAFGRREPPRILWQHFVADTAPARAAWRQRLRAVRLDRRGRLRLPTGLIAGGLRLFAASAAPAPETLIDPRTGLFHDPARRLDGAAERIANALADDLARGVRGGGDTYPLVFHAFTAACLTAELARRLAGEGVPEIFAGEMLRAVIERIWRVRPKDEPFANALAQAARSDASLSLARVLTRIAPETALVHARNYLGHPRAAIALAIEEYERIAKGTGLLRRRLRGLLGAEELKALRGRARLLPESTAFGLALWARPRQP